VRAGFLVVVTLVLGALAANFLLADNGYVLINFRGYAIEMSVPVLALLLLLAYLAVRFLIQIWRAPRRLGEMAAERKVRKAGERIVRGYIEMGEGNFARGERLLTKGVRNSETPLLNYLAAARAAQAQGDKGRRDNWLKMAYEQEPRAKASVLITQAELQVENKEYEAALATLNQLLELTPRNAEALRIKAEVCVAREDWSDLRSLLPKLSKSGHVADQLTDSWYVSAWSALLAEASDSPDQVGALWKELPKHLRANPKLMQAHLEALVKEGRAKEAEAIIRKTLNTQWSEELIRLYGKLEVDDSAVLLHRAEKWLRQRPDDPVLLLTVGRLSVRNELWGKARSYFESSIGILPTAESWHELGQLLTRMGNSQAASDAYQKGLTLSYGGTGVPRIAARPAGQAAKT
jgi:HemY protein